ncbi:hypothetical protein AVEN_121151-1 [Araneus ventricosus]|uniref:Uncharacterized protein n=1 Tax=Araneus ventricosus TaxID=182803 RepID=A0A4Y2E2S3_ARAVE|nr:hypothetical protein AVEN_121151-1 [Araneus ventricosus]
MWNGLDCCLKVSWRQFTPSILQGSSQIHRSERWWKSLLNIRCKANQICSIMFMSGDLDGLWKCLRSQMYSWSHSVANFDVWGVALSFWNCPNPPECTMDMNGYR